MAISLPTTTKLNFLKLQPSSPSMKKRFLNTVHCAPNQQTQQQGPHRDDPLLIFGEDDLHGEKIIITENQLVLEFLTPSKEDVGIMCEPCSGKGWLLCSFCNGQKTNVKAENNRIYRRCPSCRAIGYVLCSKCKVFKCVTFPDYSDGGEL